MAVAVVSSTRQIAGEAPTAGVMAAPWLRLLAGRWMATDGTGLKVLIPGLPKAHNGYLELYRNRELAVFQYSPTKDGDRVAAMLRPFRGKLTADAVVLTRSGSPFGACATLSFFRA